MSDNSDQSPVTGAEAAQLRQRAEAAAMTVGTLGPVAEALLVGDSARVRTLLASDPQALLRRFHDDMHLTCLHLLVLGAKTGSGKHEDALQALLSYPPAFALVDARDAAGRTALALACGDMEQPELAGTLLEAGADPAAADRTGRTPLHAAVASRSARCVELLVRRGAPSDVPDCDGKTARDLVAGAAAIEKLLNHDFGDGAEAEADGPRERVCAAAGCGKPAGSVCARCHAVWYCSRECQRAHWKAGHKATCRPDAGAELRKMLSKLGPGITVASDPEASKRKEQQQARAVLADGIDRSERFVAAVRAPKEADEALGPQPLLCVDRERRRQQFIPSGDADYQSVLDAVHKHGEDGKAFFTAWIDEVGKMRFDLEHPLPAQQW